MKHGVPFVPAQVIEWTSDGPQVYVIDSNQTVHVRRVTTGVQDREKIEITSGLSPGETIVADHQGKLEEGAKVLAPPAPRSKAPAETPVKTALVPQSVVDAARTNLTLAQHQYEAGLADYVSVLEADQHLHWAEAMAKGDRAAAAIANRDGTRKRLALMEKMRDQGLLDPAKLAPVQQELAEAEAALAGSGVAHQIPTPPGSSLPSTGERLAATLRLRGAGGGGLGVEPGETPVEEDLRVLPFVGAVEQREEQGVAALRHGAGVGVARRDGPAGLRRPMPG